jgi:hypothetical protein
MPPSREPTVEELREESERTRAALASTVGELRERVSDTAAELKTRASPTHVKEEIKEYIRGERESLIKSVQRKAQENPLQLAAVGAAIAYPAWGLLRAIPTPLLLIGAGLFLTSKKGQQSAKEVKAQVDLAVQRGTERVVDAAAGIQSDLEDRMAGARSGVEELRDTVSSAAETVVDKARAKFHDTTDAVKNAASGIVDKTSAAADRVADGAATSAEDLKGRAASTARDSRDAVLTFVNDNALLVAGIGAAVGAFIAASIPASDAENQLFGAGSAKLKDQAREAAARGIEKAGDIAAGAVGSVASAAAREGLDATGVRQALNTVAESVRAVADRGIDTAIGSAPHQNQQPVTERNPS